MQTGDRWERVLSHRLRGFAPIESTLDGMTAALAAGVRHVEFDARVTRDGALIAYHDPIFQADDGSWQQVEAWGREALVGQRRMRHVPTVAEMVARFAVGRTPRSRLHVDMKVAGQEDALLAILQSAGVREQTVLVSWTANVLQEFHARAPAVPLCFSHITFARTPRLYGVAKRLGYPPLRRGAVRALGGLAPRLAAQLATARLHFHDDGDPLIDPAIEDRAGFDHAHVVLDLLAGRMLRLLQATRGFAAVPGWCLHRALVERYHDLGVQVAVFAAKDAAALERMLSAGADIVYVDDAGLFR